MGQSANTSIMNCKTILVVCLAALVSSANGSYSDSVLGGSSGSSGFVRSGGISGSDGFAGAGGFARAFGGRAGGPDIIVVTQTRTIDQIETRVSTVFNTQPVTQTDFVLQTVTSQTYQVIRTPGNEDVRISTVAVVQPVVEEVTDVWRNYVLNTRLAEQLVTVLHEEQDVHFATVTRTVQEEIVVTEQLVQTQVVTDYNQVTDYRYVTHYEYVQAGGRSDGFGNDFASDFGRGSNRNIGSGYGY